MNDKYVKGKRNLLILSWMGLVCQGVGLLMAVGSLVGFLWDEKFGLGSLGGIVFLVFGMALGGWSSNLSEIVDLKKRVAELETGKATQPAV